MTDTDRAVYLQELRMVVNAHSPWLLRDFLQRWSATVGPLAPVLTGKSDDDLRSFLGELGRVLSGQSSHQLASQLTAPWLITTRP